MLRLRILLNAVMLAGVGFCIQAPSGAQITNQIRVTMSHAFVIGNSTLPPGEYDFRMVSNSDMSVMTVRSVTGNESVEFLVRQSEADHIPQHTELVFNRYGNDEFLRRIFEKGNRHGVTVEEPSREEVRLQKEGQHGIEHTETQ